MRKLLLIKHAAPHVIPAAPAETWTLSDKGRASCAGLAERLREHEPALIVASEEPKASETAKIVGEALNVPVRTAAGLHEHDRSNVPHMRSGEFISMMELFFRKPGERVLGRESAEEALVRFDDAVQKIVAENSAGNIAVVSHGTVIALWLAKYADRKGFDLWREMGLPSFAVISLPEMKLLELVARV